MSTSTLSPEKTSNGQSNAGTSTPRSMRPRIVREQAPKPAPTNGDFDYAALVTGAAQRKIAQGKIVQGQTFKERQAVFTGACADYKRIHQLNAKADLPSDIVVRIEREIEAFFGLLSMATDPNDQTKVNAVIGKGSILERFLSEFPEMGSVKLNQIRAKFNNKSGKLTELRPSATMTRLGKFKDAKDAAFQTNTLIKIMEGRLARLQAKPALEAEDRERIDILKAKLREFRAELKLQRKEAAADEAGKSMRKLSVALVK